jgi:hypothetical protein
MRLSGRGFAILVEHVNAREDNVVRRGAGRLRPERLQVRMHAVPAAVGEGAVVVDRPDRRSMSRLTPC